MKNALLNLVGEKVLDAGHQLDYLQIKFTCGAILNVFNKHSIQSKKNPQLVSLNLIGLKLCAIELEPKTLVLRFDQIDVEVSLDDSAYIGPEALQLILSNGKIFVWV